MQSILIHLPFSQISRPCKGNWIKLCAIYSWCSADVCSLPLSRELFVLPWGEWPFNEEGDPHWEGEGWGADRSPCWPLWSQEDAGQDQPTLLLEGNYQRFSWMGKWSICSSCVWSRSALIFPVIRWGTWDLTLGTPGHFYLLLAQQEGSNDPYVVKVKTCMSCQRFEHVKTEAPELKPIKPKSPRQYDWWDILLLGSVKRLQPLEVIV